MPTLSEIPLNEPPQIATDPLASGENIHSQQITRLSTRRRWAIGATGAITALLLFAVLSSQHPIAPLMATRGLDSAAVPTDFRSDACPRETTVLQPQAGLAGGESVSMRTAAAYAPTRSETHNGVLANSIKASGTAAQAPMIARTVSLSIQVKDVAQARPALDAILARCQGYAAQLAMNTPENDARSFSASLRIPAAALSAALTDLRSLGRVQSESQSGEEVTQEHTGLVARLKNARETEQRLLAILQQRTGKVSDVLEVEEQISSTRGEIEQMEAQQKALDHRVDFATVQLQLAEEYKAQLNPPSTSVGTRMHNALVTGLSNAGGNILGIVLFFVEYGPVLLVWFTILGAPVWVLWRYYRGVQSRI